jgi:hypothetical protein
MLCCSESNYNQSGAFTQQCGSPSTAAGSCPPKEMVLLGTPQPRSPPTAGSTTAPPARSVDEIADLSVGARIKMQSDQFKMQSDQFKMQSDQF